MSYHANVLEAAKANTFFRQVLYTTDRTQVVVMCIQPGEDIGAEVHDLDQVLVFVSGRGEYILDDAKGQVGAGEVVVVPAGTRHNFITSGDEPMKLYTVYAPPEHPDGTIHKTKDEAEIAEAEEHGHAPPPKSSPTVPRGLTVGSLMGK